MPNILQTILAQKQVEIADLNTASLRRAAEESPPPRDFLAALAAPPRSEYPALIAELKRASPSKGILAPQLNLLHAAELYAQNGAAALSVLTDEKFFQGKLETLRQLRAGSLGLPLLCKDFLIHEAQIYQARANGADAVLLIVAALPEDTRLAELHACALSLGLTPLVEVHDEAETERALRLPSLRLIGINNRDLSAFQTSLQTTERLRPQIPASLPVVAESGISSAEDVARLARAGVSAILVGEALVTAGDIAAKVRELTGQAAP